MAVPLPAVAERMNNPKNPVVFFDVTIGGQEIGRMQFELFQDIVPKTVENFRQFCTGEYRKDGVPTGYKGTSFHRIIKDFMVQGGDFINGDGTGSFSIYGGVQFADENFHVKHCTCGMLSMANSGRDTNGCQFFITCAPCDFLDGKHVVFGRIVDGMLVLKKIENVPTGANNRPKVPVLISQCGEITRISELNDSDAGNLSKLGKRRQRLRVLDDDDDDDDDKSDKENEYNAREMSTSLSNLPSSIPVVASSRIPQVEESSSSEGERHDVYESDEESRSVTEEEEADSDDNRPNSLYSINKYSRQDGLRRNAVHRAHSPSDNRARPTEDDGDDVQEPLPGADDDAVDIGVLERLRKMSKGAAKRVVKNPRPKLDPQCLLSNKGLPALLDDFKKVKFRGKGHEFQDLEKLLYVYEAWANRVVPRLTFPEVVERLEHVGSKREIHVALDRLRNGIWPPYASNEQVEPSEDESEREHEDPDALWRSVIESVPQNTPTAKNTPPKTNDVFKDLNSTDYQDTQDSIDDSNLHLPQASTSYSSESRVERNRRLALERLAARKSSAGTLITNKLKTPTNHILKNALKAAISAAPSSSNSELTNKLSSEFSINEKSDDINSSNTLTQNSNAHNTTLVDTMSSHTVINATNDDLHHSVLEQFSENHNDDVLSTVLQEVESPCYVDESNLVIDLS